MSALWIPRLVTSREEIELVFSFLRQPHFALGYPSYDAWLEQAREQLIGGVKRSYAVRNLEGKIIATAIFQEQRDDATTIELKNRRVDPVHCRQGIGLALAAAVEEYARQRDYKAVYADTHETNFASIGSLKKAGFREEGRGSLYDPNINEVTLLKRL